MGMRLQDAINFALDPANSVPYGLDTYIVVTSEGIDATTPAGKLQIASLVQSLSSSARTSQSGHGGASMEV